MPCRVHDILKMKSQGHARRPACTVVGPHALPSCFRMQCLLRGEHDEKRKKGRRTCCVCLNPSLVSTVQTNSGAADFANTGLSRSPINTRPSRAGYPHVICNVNSIHGMYGVVFCDPKSDSNMPTGSGFCQTHHTRHNRTGVLTRTLSGYGDRQHKIRDLAARQGWSDVTLQPRPPTPTAGWIPIRGNGIKKNTDRILPG